MPLAALVRRWQRRGETADLREGWEEERPGRGAVLEVVKRCTAWSSNSCLIVQIKG